MKKLPLIILIISFHFLHAQNYQAIKGSPYTGSLSVSNNPASIEYASGSWDIIPLAAQMKQTTNAFVIKNYSLFSGLQNAKADLIYGDKKRFFYANQDIHLLNTRIDIGENSAIAFGINFRSYMYLVNSKTNWQDTTANTTDFMKINLNNAPLSGNSAASIWMEYYVSYARKILEDDDKMLNAGITLKINRSFAGAFASVKNVNFEPITASSTQRVDLSSGQYLLTSGGMQYGYSSSIDNLTDTSNHNAIKQLFSNAQTSLGADIGIEYISFTGDNNLYDTKIGVSILDIGGNHFVNGNNSISISEPQNGITDHQLRKKFIKVKTPAEFNDSLSSIANIVTPLTGNFRVYNPTRLVINIDHSFGNNFYLNADLTVPLMALAPENTVYIKDMNFLSVTPRWEIRSWGLYLPVQYNIRSQVWVGSAVRMGPVLIGLHNLANIFAKNKMQSGGGYLAFIIKPGRVKESDNPYLISSKLTARDRRKLNCPAL